MTEAEIREFVTEVCSPVRFDTEEEKAHVIDNVVALVVRLLDYPKKEVRDG